MTDIRERFSVLDQINIPDLREDVLLRELHPLKPESHRYPTGARRASIALAALLLAGAVLVLLTDAFHHHAQVPVSPPSTSSVPTATNGLIAFQAGAGRLYTMKPDGSDLTPITSAGPGTNGAPFPAYKAAWSPDGAKIAFLGFTGHGEESQLYIADASGADVTALPNSRGLDQPSWSPDGKQLAVSGGRFIYTMPWSGGRLTKLVTGFDPAWSPDGRAIAFADGHGGIKVIDLASGVVVPLVGGVSSSDRFPAWSPDGSEVAFEACDTSSHCTVALVGADGSSEHQLTPCPTLSTCPAGPSQYSVTWSPDGRYLAFSQRGDVYTARPDGSDLRKVSDLNGGDIAWQPVPLSTRSPAAASPRPAASPKSASLSGVHWLPTTDLGVVDRQPTSILAAFGHLWVTSYVGGYHVMELNGATGAPVRRIAVGGIPNSEVGGGDMAAAAGAVWIGGREGHQADAPGTAVLTKIDPSTGATQIYPLPGTGIVDVTSDGARVYALDFFDTGSFAIVEVDPSTGNVVRTVPFAATSSTSIVALDGAVWVAERGPKSACCYRLVPVIPAPGTDPVTVPLSAVRGAGPSVAGGILWAPVRIVHGTSPWSGLAEIDPLTGRIVKQWDLGEGVAFDLIGFGNGAWVLEGSPCCADVVRLDAALGRSTVGGHSLGQDPIALAADAHNVWALTYEGHVLRIATG